MQEEERELDAIIIGGGSLPDLFRGSPYESLPNRCLITVLGEPLVTHTIRGLREVRGLRRIALVGPPLFRGQSFAHQVDSLVEEGKDETDNIFRGLHSLPGATTVLMTSADVPLLNRESLEGFLSLCPPEADICYPVVERSYIDRDFPARKWVFVKLREGHFTGGSLFLFKAEALLRNVERLRAVMDSRRNVLALAGMWGMGLFLKYLLGQLSLRDVERRVSALLRFNGRGISCPHSELAMDVDKPSDIPLVEEKLRMRFQGPGR